jgi:hypothetical protein
MVLDEAKIPKSPFPSWLLDTWQEDGLQFDRSDVQSIRQAIRVAVGPQALPPREA